MAKKKSKAKHSKSKQFVRPQKGKVLGGVCAAIANYFDLSPNIVRLVFLFLAVFTWPLMIIFYILAWVLIPKGK